jgi:hypothetical protein
MLQKIGRLFPRAFYVRVFDSAPSRWPAAIKKQTLTRKESAAAAPQITLRRNFRADEVNRHEAVLVRHNRAMHDS